MIREEYNFERISDYLNNNVTAVIVGPDNDERSKYIFNYWQDKGIFILRIAASNDSRSVDVQAYQGRTLIDVIDGEFTTTVNTLLVRNKECFKITCIDISSMHHALIMFLIRKFTKEVKPLKLFATYVEPRKYIPNINSGNYSLTKEILGLTSVPGFIRREKGKERLIAFLGFDGHRLNNIVETHSNIQQIIPIISFPSYNPSWLSESLWNCMRVIDNNDLPSSINKCKVDSVFDAYEMIKKIANQDINTVCALAPLGARPHTVACALYATENPNTRIIYDNPVENTPRSEGISIIKVYHLSSFIST